MLTSNSRPAYPALLLHSLRSGRRSASVALIAVCLPLAACGAPDSSTPEKPAPAKTAAAPAPVAAPAPAKQAPAKAPAAPAVKAESPAAGVAAVAAVGAEATALFAGRCAVCHGATGQGDGPTAAAMDPKSRNLADPAWLSSVTDAEIKKAIVEGGVAVGKSPLMPPNPDLGGRPELLDALVARIRAFGKG